MRKAGSKEPVSLTPEVNPPRPLNVIIVVIWKFVSQLSTNMPDLTGFSDAAIAINSPKWKLAEPIRRPSFWVS
jgi:hypothetical protein